MKRIVAIAALAAMMALPTAAFASPSITQGYGSQTYQAKKVLSVHASRKPTSSGSPTVVQSPDSAVRSASAGSLPFTGLDLGALGAGAIVLLGAGMVLRRASTDRR
jgi:hypothetical protein